jgi:hypothetical protein
VPIFTGTSSGSGSGPFTITFRIGSTAAVNRTPAGVATWTYTVRADVGP